MSDESDMQELSDFEPAEFKIIDKKQKREKKYKESDFLIKN